MNVLLSLQSCKTYIQIPLFYSDGWTTDDLIYNWKGKGPVQIAKTIKHSLPGGFKLDGYFDQRCDVKTATGKLYSIAFSTIII